MKLPTIDHPTFEIKLISINSPVKYRPFTVREEKIMLIAEESKDSKDIMNAIKQVINNCCISDIDVDKLPLFDIEHMIIQLRSKSVSNISTLRYRDKEDGQVRSFDIDLDTIKPVISNNHSTTVKIDEKTVLTFKYPTMEMLGKIKSTEDDEIELVAACLDSIVSGEDFYDTSLYTIEEKVEWLGNLGGKSFNKIKETFIDTMPKIQHELEYINNTGKEVKIVLEGYRDFF